MTDSSTALSGTAPARWLGRVFRYTCCAGLTVFGLYILLRAGGATPRNFGQWRDLIAGGPMPSAADWVANLGIGLHYLMGAVLVLAWPVLFSARIRARRRGLHRWTGRVYVTAGFLAGAGGLAFILAHHSGSAQHLAFALWGIVMMVSALKAFVHARGRRFDLHRAWAIRLFAMVLGSWVFDLEYRAWKDLAGGVGIGAGDAMGPFDYAILYAFFVPNLLVAEFFIRDLHRRLALPTVLKWPVVVAAGLVGAAFVYAAVVVTAAPSGKYGRHLLALFTD